MRLRLFTYLWKGACQAECLHARGIWGMHMHVLVHICALTSQMVVLVSFLQGGAAAPCKQSQDRPHVCQGKLMHIPAHASCQYTRMFVACMRVGR
jgi:hypothetical protein